MRRLLVTSTAVVLGLALLPPGAAVPGGATAHKPGTFPARIELPDGFQRADRDQHDREHGDYQQTKRPARNRDAKCQAAPKRQVFHLS